MPGTPVTHDTSRFIPFSGTFRPLLHFPQAPSAAATIDRDALLALYGSTDGAAWNVKEHWGTDAELSQWYGVKVDAQGRVVTLKLPYNNLQGVTVAYSAQAGYMSSFCTKSTFGYLFCVATRPLSLRVPYARH